MLIEHDLDIVKKAEVILNLVQRRLHAGDEEKSTGTKRQE
jgi:hypothetical protein